MSELHYTTEKNVQIVIALLKAYGINQIIASPGSTNIPFVMSVQNDPYFKVVSSVDERSAAYMACGMAAESQKPVVLSCTGATASRNYFPGLTEAFYRKLPIIALTSTRPLSMIGNLEAQVIDRTQLPKDVAVESVFAPLVTDSLTEWDCKMKVNKALIALTRNGGGPVHINLETKSAMDFSVSELPDIRPIARVTIYDEFPEVPKGKIGIMVGSHLPFGKELTSAIDLFCENYNAVVFCDQTSNYRGKYRIMAPIMGAQDKYKSTASYMDVLIHMGELCGAYEEFSIMTTAKNVWRLNEDGVPRDQFHKLNRVFDMPEIEFFSRFNNRCTEARGTSFFDECAMEHEMLVSKIPSSLPFSNISIAHFLSGKLPANSVLHMAILNSLRAWNFFETDSSIRGYCNVGGFGIDGAVSTMIGASLVHSDKIYYCIIGDLAFFYDLNSMANRHVGNNVRILMVNNGHGQEFRNYTHPASRFGEETDKFVAAAGHFGNKSTSLVKGYAESLGYEYLSAHSQKEFESNVADFVNPEIGDRPVIFEVFTETQDENSALEIMRNLAKSNVQIIKNEVRKAITNVVGEEGFDNLRRKIKK